MGLFYIHQNVIFKKTSSPRQMAIVIFLVTSLILGITQIILANPVTKQGLLPLVFSIMIVFIINYVIVYFLLNSFIPEKLNPIYKTTHNLNFTENELRKELEEKDVIKEVNTEVVNLVNKKNMK